jgi:hypothetical protein
MNSMTIDIVLLVFFLKFIVLRFWELIIIRGKKLIQLRNLILEFKLPFIFHVMSTIIVNLNSIQIHI